MDKEKTALLEKLSEIETLVSDIYMRFSNLVEEDRDFWWRLSMEERGHASLIRSGIESFGPLDLFPKEITDIPLDEVNSSIEAKRRLLDSLSGADAKIERLAALKLSCEMEAGDIEGCFQRLMETTDESRMHKIFRILNKDSAEHAKRIKERFEAVSALGPVHK